MIKTPSVENYLRALSAACREAADEPRVRPLLFALLLIAPRTLWQLAAEQRRRLVA
jgi:hypothetical protein